jgi:hypothetical protein
MPSTLRQKAGCFRSRAEIPEQPLEVLAEGIVAEVAARECAENELYALVLHDALGRVRPGLASPTIWPP